MKEGIGNYGSHMLFQSALFSRLGVTYLSGAYCELLLHCYNHGCPLDESLRATGRRGFLVRTKLAIFCSTKMEAQALQKGRYDEALQLLGSIDASSHRSLKFHQYVFLCTGLVKLKRAMHR